MSKKEKKRDLQTFLDENPIEQYYPEGLKNGTLTLSQMKKDYSYLREIANKRLARFENTEFAGHKSYTQNAGKFVRLSEIKDDRELMYRLLEVNKFVRAESSSVTGLKQIRNRAIETARSRGLYWINKDNIGEFGEYMDYLRTKYGSRQFDSERAAELFGLTKTAVKIDPMQIAEDFGYWQSHVEDLESIPKHYNKTAKNADDYRKIIDTEMR